MAARKTFSLVQPWVSTGMRIAAGLVMIIAGYRKAEDLHAAVRATRAYEILPESLVSIFGQALPFVEIAVGLFLVAGLLTRWAAFAYLLLLAVFVFGTIWAWARGLQIDCGCFGGGGAVAKADYPGHLIDQAIFISLGLWVAIFPVSALSLDRWLRPVVD